MHTLGGRTLPAIELLTDVSKAGSWRQVVAAMKIVCCADDKRLLKKAFTNPDFLFIIKG